MWLILVLLLKGYVAQGKQIAAGHETVKALSNSVNRIDGNVSKLIDGSKATAIRLVELDNK